MGPKLLLELSSKTICLLILGDVDLFLKLSCSGASLRSNHDSKIEVSRQSPTYIAETVAVKHNVGFILAAPL